MSREFLRKLKTSLERSVDTREWVVPNSRRRNIEQTKAINHTLLLDDDSTLLSILHEILNNSYIKKFEKSYTFILEMGFEKIENVLNNAFKDARDNIKLDTCIFEEELLTHITVGDLVYKRLRVFKLLNTFNKMQRAYREVVPLVNLQTPPEGRYDSIYLPRTLFTESEEIQETYRRIRRHCVTFIRTILQLIHYTVYDTLSFSLNTTIENLSNYTRSRNITSAYLLDMKLYESLVINKPLEHLKNAKRKFVDRKIRITAKNVGLQQNVDFLGFTLKKFKPRLVSLRHALDKCNITTFWRHLEDERPVSKLKLAKRFMSENITEHITHVKASLAHISQQFDQCVFYIQEVDMMVCQLYAAAGSEPILQEMYDKLFDYYKHVNSSEKEEMIAYFKLDDPDGYRARLMRGDMSLNECHNATTRDISNEAEDMNIWLIKLTSFTEKLTRFRKDSQLHGTFFR